MKLFSKALALSALALGVAAVPALAQSDWPNRPVTLIVAAGAGGGTDATGRLIAADLEKKFGQPFNVVNRAEGGGIAGITELANATPDGYTIGILFNYAPYKFLGMGNLTSDSYTPIAQYNFDFAAVHVKENSELKTLDEVITQLKADPQSLAIGCGATCPSSWSSAFSKVLIDQGIDIKALRWVPSAGAAAGLQELDRRWHRHPHCLSAGSRLDDRRQGSPPCSPCWLRNVSVLSLTSQLPVSRSGRCPGWRVPCRRWPGWPAGRNRRQAGSRD